MGRYTGLIGEALSLYARDHGAPGAVSARDLIRRYNPEMNAQGIGQVLKYQKNEINAVLRKDRIKVVGYGWNSRRRANMIEVAPI
jgi:hypothetical protein